MLKLRSYFLKAFFSSFSHSVRKIAEKCIKERGSHFEHKMRFVLLLLLINVGSALDTVIDQNSIFYIYDIHSILRCPGCLKYINI